MAFRGTQQPDLIGLALNLMQMRRQNELEDRRLALAEFKAKSDARIAERSSAFEMLKLGREMAGSEATAGAALGPSLSVAIDENAPEQDRAAAARAYLPGLMQEAQLRAGPGNQVTGDILNQVGNEAASAGALKKAEARAAGPKLDWEYDSSGNKRRVIVGENGEMKPVPGAVWVPPRSGVTVNVGSDGLDLNQIATTSAREANRFRERMAPFEAFDIARSTMRNVRGMADENGVLPQQASQIIASDAMAALRPEALNEGDVSRLTAVGLWNKALARVGLPPQMTVEQLDTLSKMIDDKAKAVEPKRRAVIQNGKFRAEKFGFDPRLILEEYADEIESPGSDGTTRDVQPAAGRLPAMTESDKRRIEREIRKATGMKTPQIPASMILDAWRAEHGQQPVGGR